jgi:hypothetical protein
MVNLHDATFIDRAFFLGERGRGRTTPNPIVGAVVVSPRGVVVGQGAHLEAGGRTPRSSRSIKPVLMRETAHCTARSSRARTPDVPVRASSASSVRASSASSFRFAIRIRACRDQARRICARTGSMSSKVPAKTKRGDEMHRF